MNLSSKRTQRALRIAGLFGLAAALIALGRSGVFERALDAVESLGPWAMPGFVALHVLSVIAFIPSAVPNLAAGMLFGIGHGFAVSIIGAGIGAGLTFGLGRLLGRQWLERRFGGDARFRSLIRQVSERGWRIIVLARLTPIFPFAIANYAFGLTRMRALDYGLASMLGSIPSTLVLVSLGAAAGRLRAGSGERSPGEWALLVLGIVATLALLLAVRRIAREAFADLPATSKAAGQQDHGAEADVIDQGTGSGTPGRA